MKKMIIGLVALGSLASAVSLNAAVAGKGEIVSIDSILLMQRSLAGQELGAKIQKKVESLQKDINKSQKELVDMQEAISKKAKVLSQEALQEKTEELGNKKKNFERELADKEESLRLSVQKDQIALREKQMAVINDVFEKEGWMMLVDRNTPGVLCVSNAIDKTEEILKIVDSKFEKTKKASKVEPTAKTVKSPTQSKQSVKNDDAKKSDTVNASKEGSDLLKVA